MKWKIQDLISETVPASLARSFGSALLGQGAFSVSLDNFQYYDGMIPVANHLLKDKKIEKNEFGNLVALSLQVQELLKGFSHRFYDLYTDFMSEPKKIASMEEFFRYEMERHVRKKTEPWNI